MDPVKLGSGDNLVHVQSAKYQMKSDDEENEKDSRNHESQHVEDVTNKMGQSEVTPQMIDDNEAKLKERIAQCRSIIESLKIELNEEKSKLEKQTKSPQPSVECPTKCTTSQYVSTSHTFLEDFSFGTTGIYTDCVDSKLNCDENLIEYEKQLQKYQNTLNMAQIEKKNAIRKQMLAKAYRLKLLEVENQCNIELLRVKQSLQCLEPLQMIANKWKSSADNMYDVNNFELTPRYPELNANSNCDMNICGDEFDIKSPIENGDVTKDCYVSSD
ncbi:uncharacterized protein LOC142973895 [Anticarsia gemmatalis]|uniref:uncharacterized protein LOC142973895 n=1 Tax=Anticarsia gemmatalis TaxID=129554 RepID=UPI003F770F10